MNIHYKKDMIIIHPYLQGEFVEENEGTGFVHIAPSYGEDDFNLAKLHNIEIKDIVMITEFIKKILHYLLGYMYLKQTKIS